MSYQGAWLLALAVVAAVVVVAGLVGLALARSLEWGGARLRTRWRAQRGPARERAENEER